jgi:hypothetical protein
MACSKTTILHPVCGVSLAKVNARCSGLRVIVSSVCCCVGCCAVAVAVGSVPAVVVVGVIVECGAIVSDGVGGGGAHAVASLASAMPISPRHLRNISWIPSPSYGGMATWGYSSPCGTGTFRAYNPLQGTRVLEPSQQHSSLTSGHASGASYASWRKERVRRRHETLPGARTGGDDAPTRRG